jgi:hypothetical protein
MLHVTHSSNTPGTLLSVVVNVGDHHQGMPLGPGQFLSLNGVATFIQKSKADVQYRAVVHSGG